jgi:hypothetical protein
MARTLDALVAHLERTSATAKVIVWAHNSHLGDERATELAQAYGDFSDVHRCATLAAESRTGQRKYADVENAAAHLHGMLDALRGRPPEGPPKSRPRGHAGRFNHSCGGQSAPRPAAAV